MNPRGSIAVSPAWAPVAPRPVAPARPGSPRCCWSSPAARRRRRPPRPRHRRPPSVRPSPRPRRSQARARRPRLDPRPTPTPGPPADVALRVVADGLTAPVGLVAAPDGSGRSFVLDQTGLILILRDGRLEEGPFLDIRDRIVELDPEYDERGLLGLAFHPEFATERRFFVYYGAPPRDGAAAGQDHTNTLSEFRVSAYDPDRRRPGRRSASSSSSSSPSPTTAAARSASGPTAPVSRHRRRRRPGRCQRGPLGAGQRPGSGQAQRQGPPASTSTGRSSRTRSRPTTRSSDGGGRPEIYASASATRGGSPGSRTASGASSSATSATGATRRSTSSSSAATTAGGSARAPTAWTSTRRSRTRPTATRSARAASPSSIRWSSTPTATSGSPSSAATCTAGRRCPALRGQYVFADFSADWTNDPRPRGRCSSRTPSPEAGVPWHWRRLEIDDAAHRFITGMGEDADGELYLLTRGRLGPEGDTGEVRQLVAPQP